MKRIVPLFVLLAVAGCGEKNPAEDVGTGGADAGKADPAATGSSPSANSDEAGRPPEKEVDASEAGAKALLSAFLAPAADHAKLSAALAPTSGDYTAAFVGDAAAKAEAGYKQAWADGRMVLKPNAGQTELLLWKATSEELNAGTGDAKQFPGGYQEIAKHLKPGVTWYRFKFVEPGETLGMAFDGLACINGRWTIFPKPWRVLR